MKTPLLLATHNDGKVREFARLLPDFALTGAGAELDDETLRAFVRAQLAGYKVPKAFVAVPQVQRAPNGKADYRWARATAEAAA